MGGGTHSNNIPRDRRILLRKKKKLHKKLRNTNSAESKAELENSISEIDKKLLESHEENIAKETRALEKIKSNPKHFFAYANKKLETRSKIGPFDKDGEKIDKLVDICIKLVEQ